MTTLSEYSHLHPSKAWIDCLEFLINIFFASIPCLKLLLNLTANSSSPRYHLKSLFYSFPPFFHLKPLFYPSLNPFTISVDVSYNLTQIDIYNPIICTQPSSNRKERGWSDGSESKAWDVNEDMVEHWAHIVIMY